MLLRTHLCWLAAFVTLSSPATAKKKDVTEKEQKAEEKNVSQYEKLKQYSVDRYANNPDFREQVDQAYDDLMRKHSERAYLRNTGISSYIANVREDRWRVHENLYDNLLVQDHINRIGQRLVPAGSERALAFKVIPEPTPLAETLATGTIYVSTGLISVLDSEAQLAYVLAHEMAHVQLEHWKERVKMDEGQKAYADEQSKKSARIGLFTTLAGAALGGALGQSAMSTIGGAVAGAAVGLVAGQILNRPLIVSWDKVEEDAADEYAFKAVLNSSYDVREIPNLYIAMQKVTARDTRIALGFLGDRHRIEQRQEKAKDLIEHAYKAEIEGKLKDGFLSTSAEHRNLMAELKRDNGIMAYYHDMFELAKLNLAEATAIRENDPAAHYFYAKVLKLVGRTDDDQRLARTELFKAAKFDSRDENFGTHLHLALMMTREKDADKHQITQELDAYVSKYARWNVMDRVMRSFPPNLETIYEYMTLYGDPGWTPKPPDLKDLPSSYQLLAASADGPTAPRVPAGAPKVDAAATPVIGTQTGQSSGMKVPGVPGARIPANLTNPLQRKK